MNEIRDLIIGIDFGREYSQICYYDRKAGEPCSLSVKAGSTQYEVPTLLCSRADHGDYCVGLEAEYFAKEKGGELIDGLYDLTDGEAAVCAGGETREPWELLAFFLKGLLKLLGVMDVVNNTKCLVLTARTLGSRRVQNLQKALEKTGFSGGHYILMDYGESFYYYTLTGKRETWSRSVGWYDFCGNQVSFRKLVQQPGSRPVLVRLTDPETLELTPLPGIGGEQTEDAGAARDRQFSAFVEKTLGRDLFSSIQITGPGFDTGWAVQSVKLLCRQQRKVFYGNNLFAKGACAAGKERLENHALKGCCYFSPSLVLTDVGMNMRVMGSRAYYPLIEAGRNWYESRAYCELILDDTEDLVFEVSYFGKDEKKKVAMHLPGLPRRPNKTTRLSLSLSFTAPGVCQILVKDLGFGEMFPSGGKVWKEEVSW